MLLPAHLRDVDQPVDARGDLDEGAEWGQAHDDAFDLAANIKLVVNPLPRVVLGRLDRQADAQIAALLLFDIEDFDLDGVALGDHVRGLVDRAVAQLRDMHHALDAADVDERAEVEHAGDLAADDLVDLEALKRLFAALGALFFEQRGAADDDISALFGDLLDAEAVGIVEVNLGVVGVAELDLADRAEGAHAADGDLKAA